MVGFNEKWIDAPVWQRANFIDIVETLGNIELTDNENRCLLWIAFQDKETRETLISIFKKLKEGEYGG